MISPALPPLPLLLQSLYGLVAASIVLANSIPALQKRFVGYGKTSPTTTTTTAGTTGLLDKLATITIPHSYFTHFYLSALLLSLFWMVQIVTRGTWYQSVAGMAGREGGMGIEQVVLVWMCFIAQVGRRLYECLYVQKSGSESRMWVAHYLVGLLFYAAMAVGVWVEGISMCSVMRGWVGGADGGDGG